MNLSSALGKVLNGGSGLICEASGIGGVGWTDNEVLVTNGVERKEGVAVGHRRKQPNGP